MGTRARTHKGYVDDEMLARLKRRMDDLGIGPTELARMTGEAQQSVSRWLRGTSRVPATFVAACERAGVAGAAWLLTGRGSPDVTEAEAQEVLERVRALVALRSPSDVADDVESAVDDRDDATGRTKDPGKRGAGGG